MTPRMKVNGSMVRINSWAVTPRSTLFITHPSL
jgi:hypothetical protein